VSGTGHFRNPIGSRTPRPGPAPDPVREHLGDRLAAFVDGELRDDARDRVLSHIATCEVCKAEADEQRRLKNAVAGALPPALSAGLLARLQGLPGCPPGGPGDPGRDAGDDDPGRPAAGRGFGGLGEIFGSRGDAKSYLTPQAEPLGGFPVHEFARPASRGRRLAFAAAGAFSLAALALGAALPLDSAFDGAPDPVNGAAATPVGMSRSDAQRTAPPAATPASVDIARPEPAAHARRLPLAPPTTSPSSSTTAHPTRSAAHGSHPHPRPTRTAGAAAPLIPTVAPTPTPLLLPGPLPAPHPLTISR
jgi:hypothetical protein